MKQGLKYTQLMIKMLVKYNSENLKQGLGFS